nr:hypothetical protein [Tanacetum cinerariifolium]
MALARSEACPCFFLPYWGVSLSDFQLVFCDRAWHTSHVLWFPCKNIKVPLQECPHRRPASVRQRPPIDTSCS